MAEFKTTTVVEAKAVITFNESELRALDAMTGYGADAFLEVFYEKLGKSYMQPHEQGLRSLFKTIRTPVAQALRDADQARKVLRDAQKTD
ncbi:hypothetical protein RSK20926_11619 [Roseobacter sp. SK209-2-6]|uniref:hypothetical protein n=1 Tax=Roseobacter sp. SK209-2-6 TaxID=388739 RepID=UPI0000F3C61B|nr:hypothetical protein [Roseobacter sp. SK209-2-6]EBA18365.1 hypothetical protein RSK20926_11619 [Roseobacter sp. SK209-2-6]